MVSLVSASASLDPHLHLDPSLQVQGKSRFTCLFISCCRAETHDDRVYVYCDKHGCVKPFDMEAADDVERRVDKTNQRIAHLVGEKRRLEAVFSETNVDLISKVANTKPITVEEIKKVVDAVS